MDQVPNTLLPVFLVIALGYALARRAFLSQKVLAELNKLIFWVCLPALIVGKLATAGEIPDGTGRILLVFYLTTLAVIGLGFLAAKVLRLEHRQTGTFVQATFRGNLAYTGVPLILFAMQGKPADVVASTMAQTLFVFAPGMLLYNVAAVAVLAREQDTSVRSNLSTILKKIAGNPLIIASGIGTALFLLPFGLPRFAVNALDLTGQMAAPAALLCVGGSMAFVSMEGRYRSASVATFLKIVAAPCIAYLISLPFGLEDTPRLVLLVLCACPTAVASYIMAKEMNGDEALASGAIVISTVASMPVLAVILALN